MKISLEKQTEKVKISLVKRDILTPPVVRVGELIDISGSMYDSYNNGAVSSIVFRTLALANTFDDNGEMDMWAFNTGCHELTPATKDNFEEYVKKEIINTVGIGGGTYYTPALKTVLNFYYPESAASDKPQKTGLLNKLFSRKKDVTTEQVVNKSDPALVLFITDGDNMEPDDSRVEQVIKDSQKHDIYWMLIGIGHDSFSTLEYLADKYPNVGFLNFKDLSMSDDDLYDGIINQEFVDWVKK